MAENNKRRAVKITVTCADWRIEEPGKSLAFKFEDNEDTPGEVCVTAEMVNMTGRDLYTAVAGAVELGMKLGMFNDTAGGEQ